jgi:hypothetical protein
VHAADLAVMGGLEPGLLAAQLAVLAGDLHALAGALANQAGLELGDDGEDLQEHECGKGLRPRPRPGPQPRWSGPALTPPSITAGAAGTAQ